MVRSRAWWTLVIVVGGIGSSSGLASLYDVVLKRRSAELLGWAGRLASNKSIDSLDDFLIQIVWSVPVPPSVSVDCTPERS